jgi:O-phospho-L-seryl-tRNASec:L-selenocysteinyl-tRNA synthase
VPCCTGLTLALTLSSIRCSELDRMRREGQKAAEGDVEAATPPPADCNPYPQRDDILPKSVVLWSRIDQKSCVKAVQSLGLTLLVVPTKKCSDAAASPADADGLSTDIDAFKSLLHSIGGPSKVLAFISTTSCFAPRLPDDVASVASLAATHSIPHVVNDAYGLQCPATCRALNRAARLGRLDAVVCSLDKNFLVPVGGALVFGPRKDVVNGIAANYPGRASAAPALDLFVTLLEMGEAGYRGLRDKRGAMLDGFRVGLERVAAKHGERVLQCRSNTISFGITLATIPDEFCGMLGSMLFSRCCSGCRVVVKGSTKDVGGLKFKGFGSSHDEYGVTYLTAACAIGMREEEAREFFDRLDKCLADVKKKIEKKAKKDKVVGSGGGGGGGGGGEAE